MAFTTFDPTTWPAGIIQLLDDHHLVVISSSAKARRQFGNTLARELAALSDTEVISIDGSAATDLPSFCMQLERKLTGNETMSPWWRDVHSVIKILREASNAPKRRYFVWHEAQTMLEADVELFCRLVNAFFGVAAER